jgi:hypothetical protein
VAKPAGAWTKLRDLVEHIEALNARQSYEIARAMELTTAERHVREAARALLTQVSRIADLEGLEARGRRIFPHPDENAPTADVILAVRTAAGLAGPHEATFVNLGMPPTFIADLHAAGDALEGAVADRADSAGSQRGATAAIHEEVKRAGGQLDFLESLLSRHLTTGMEAEWKQARSLGRNHRAAPAAKTVVETPILDVQRVIPDVQPVEQKALPPADILRTAIARLLRWKTPSPHDQYDQLNPTTLPFARFRGFEPPTIPERRDPDETNPLPNPGAKLHVYLRPQRRDFRMDSA